jgi:hypothetical protein
MKVSWFSKGIKSYLLIKNCIIGVTKKTDNPTLGDCLYRHLYLQHTLDKNSILCAKTWAVSLPHIGANRPAGGTYIHLHYILTEAAIIRLFGTLNKQGVSKERQVSLKCPYIDQFNLWAIIFLFLLFVCSVLCILFSSCRLAFSDCPHWSFSVLFPQL